MSRPVGDGSTDGWRDSQCNCPATAWDTTAYFDAEAAVELLQVLEQHNLVFLDGNTWKPTPELEENSMSVSCPR
jgi:hypothetical protein